MNNLSLLQWNIRSFRAQQPYLLRAIEELEPNIICLQETNLKSYQKLKLAGYSNVYRRDRGRRVGGGVAILISNNIKAIEVTIGVPDFEIIGAKVFLNKQEINIYNLYLSPDLTSETVNW